MNLHAPVKKRFLVAVSRQKERQRSTRVSRLSTQQQLSQRLLLTDRPRLSFLTKRAPSEHASGIDMDTTESTAKFAKTEPHLARRPEEQHSEAHDGR